MKKLLTFWTLFVLTLSVHAKQVFIAPNGNDNASGTISAPFKTIEKAWSKIVAGDTVYLRGGTYLFDRMQNLFGKNGTASAKIVVINYPGEQPIFSRGSGFNQTHSNELIAFSGNYIHFKGIEIANFSQRPGEHAYPAFRANPANNCTWELINYHHNAAAFSLKGNSSNNLFLNCDFSHNQDPYSASPYDGADGLDLHDLTGKNNTVKGCRAFWNADDGIDLWDNQGYVLIEDCWTFYNGYIPGTFTPAGNGTGIKLGTTPETSANLRDVKNCIAYKNFNYGIVENSGPCGMVISNCTAFGNGKIGFWFSWADNVATLKNNISYGSPQLHRMSASDIMQNNSWQNGRTADVNDFESLDDKQLLAPRKADGSLPGLPFLKVKEGSDLVGLGARFEGVVLPPVEPVDTAWTLYAPLNQYTNKTADNRAKPNAKKTLLFKGEIYERKGEYKLIIKN